MSIYRIAHNEVMHVDIRVTNDERHAIFEEDFEEFENALVYVGLNELNTDNFFVVRFVPVEEDAIDPLEVDEFGRYIRTDDDESERS